MRIHKLINTVKHLRPIQIAYQLVNRVRKKQYECLEAPVFAPQPKTGWIPKNRCLTQEQQLEFLNLKSDFTSWDDTKFGMLWTYNLNYMDWLNQPGLPKESGEIWINKFIDEFNSNSVAKDPYPIALRSINWIKYFANHPEMQSGKCLDSLFSQIVFLERFPEYHLMGNHILEDAFALFIAGNCFDDAKLLRNATKLLTKQLEEQILPDGCHFEQSPMYHCILLDRLLDCINFDKTGNEKLVNAAGKMLGHLQSIVWNDLSIPLLNDSAIDIAPTPSEIFDYADRLGIRWNKIPLKESGYRKLRAKELEAVVDVGNIMAAYQPGHTHADTFNFECRIIGDPFIVDTGISTYDKNARRQYERSTVAHNTVSVDNKDSSEVWSGFRVGSRAKVTVLTDNDCMVKASHNGFGNNLIHTRSFEISDGGFVIIDTLPDGKEGTAYLHLAPGVEVKSVSGSQIGTSKGKIKIENATGVDIKDEFVSNRYNELIPIKVVEINFNTCNKITIAQ